jgi:hypothetical protein
MCCAGENYIEEKTAGRGQLQSTSKRKFKKQNENKSQNKKIVYEIKLLQILDFVGFHSRAQSNAMRVCDSGA